MSRRSRRQVAVTFVQYLIALAALGWLLDQIAIVETFNRLLGLGSGTFLGVFAVSLLGVVAQLYTWDAVLRQIRSVDLRSVARISLVVNFVNQLLPSRLSGRLVAPFVIRSETGMNYPDAAAVSGVHTGIYAILYGCVSFLGLAAIVALESVSVGLIVLLGVSTGLYFLAGTVVLLAGSNLHVLDPLVSGMATLVARVPRIGSELGSRISGLTDFTEASTDSFRALTMDRSVWLRYSVTWSVVLLVAPAVRVWLMLSAFGVEFEPLLFLPLYLVTGYSVTLLPISPGGVGVTEATATAVFVTLGVPSGVIVPIVIVDRIFGIYLPAVLGWFPAARLDLSRLTTE